MVVSTPVASGQVDPLPDPCNVAALSPDQTQQIDLYVSKRIDDLGSDDAMSRERARRELLTPLRRPCISVTFRLGYAKAAQPGLEQLASTSDDEVAINALMVLGELATSSSISSIQSQTSDSRLAVRYAAIVAMTRSFAAARSRAPALTDSQTNAAVSHLADRLAEESNTQVVDAIVRSLLAAAAIDRDGFSSTQQAALAALSSHIGERLRQADDANRPVLMLSSMRVVEYFARILSSAGSVSTATAQDGSAIAGEILAHVAARANAGQIPEDNRQMQTDLVNLSERVLLLANTKLGGSPMQSNLKTLFGAHDDKAFFSRVRTIVLGLDSSPTNLDAAAMDRIRKALEGK